MSVMDVPGARRGRVRVVVGVRDREEGDERPEREPRGEVAVAVPVVMVMPPPRLGRTGRGEHGRERGRENEGGYGSQHLASSGTESLPAGDRQGATRPLASGSLPF